MAILQRISAPCDFLGINIYRRAVIGAGSELPPVNFRRVNPPGEYTEMGWEVWPESIHDTLVAVHRDYAPPSIFISENGAAFPDVIISRWTGPRRAARGVSSRSYSGGASSA